MTGIERLARALAVAHSDAFRSIGSRDMAAKAERNAVVWIPDAERLLAELQAPIRDLIDRWRREADELEARAVRHYDVACLSDGDRCTEKAKELRCRAAEVERALEGQGEEKCER